MKIVSWEKIVNSGNYKLRKTVKVKCELEKLWFKKNCKLEKIEHSDKL